MGQITLVSYLPFVIWENMISFKHLITKYTFGIYLFNVARITVVISEVCELFLT